MIKFTWVDEGIYVRAQEIPYALQPVSQQFHSDALDQFQYFLVWLTMALSGKVVERFLFLPLYLLQAVDGVISLALRQLVVFQAPQHLRASET